jgi:hypothetical protein
LKEKSDREGTIEKWPIVGGLFGALMKFSKPIREKFGFKEIEKK